MDRSLVFAIPGLEDCSAGLVSRILLNWPNSEAVEPIEVVSLRVDAATAKVQYKSIRIGTKRRRTVSTVRTAAVPRSPIAESCTRKEYRLPICLRH